MHRQGCVAVYLYEHCSVKNKVLPRKTLSMECWGSHLSLNLIFVLVVCLPPSHTVTSLISILSKSFFSTDRQTQRRRSFFFFPSKGFLYPNFVGQQQNYIILLQI